MTPSLQASTDPEKTFTVISLEYFKNIYYSFFLPLARIFLKHKSDKLKS